MAPIGISIIDEIDDIDINDSALPADLEVVARKIDRLKCTSDREFKSWLEEVHAALANCDTDENNAKDVAAASEILSRIFVRLEKTLNLFCASIPSDYDEQRSSGATDEQKETLASCIQAILEVLTAVPRSSSSIAQTEWILLPAFTDPSSPWTTQAICDSVSTLLQDHKQDYLSDEFLATSVLGNFIRPLFSKSRSAKVTAAGRPALPQTTPIQHPDFGNADRATKPWKYEKLYTITVFQWVIEQADGKFLSNNWHLIIPPLLTILDDTSSRIKLMGTKILSIVLPKTTEQLLTQTGLGPVFRDTLMPTLLFLPPLTPVEESLALLRATYDGLLALLDAWLPSASSAKARHTFLDRLLREGVLHGMEYCNESIPMKEYFLKEMSIIVNQMGIYSVKHLKDIVPLLSSIIGDPFAPSAPSLTVSAIEALQAVITNTWPRLIDGKYWIEIMRAISVCWVVTNDADDLATNDQGAVQKELKQACTLIWAALEGSDQKAELKTLVDSNAVFRHLFQI